MTVELNNYHARGQGLGIIMDTRLDVDVRNTGGNCMVACIDTASGFVVISNEWAGIYANENEWVNGDENATPLDEVTLDEVTDDGDLVGFCATPWAISSVRHALATLLESTTVDDDDDDNVGATASAVDYALDYLEKVTRTATNGETVTIDEGGRWRDTLNRTGYRAHFGGAWVCYTCGHLCECGESDE